jgi:hypothetical protein
MAHPPFTDGFPHDPIAAVNASYFLSESEKQDWLAWIQTATTDQKDELVDILHAMWQEHQKGAVPDQFNQSQNTNNQSFPGLDSNSTVPTPNPTSQFPVQGNNNPAPLAESSYSNSSFGQPSNTSSFNPAAQNQGTNNSTLPPLPNLDPGTSSPQSQAPSLPQVGQTPPATSQSDPFAMQSGQLNDPFNTFQPNPSADPFSPVPNPSQTPAPSQNFSVSGNQATSTPIQPPSPQASTSSPFPQNPGATNLPSFNPNDNLSSDPFGQNTTSLPPLSPTLGDFGTSSQPPAPEPLSSAPSFTPVTQPAASTPPASTPSPSLQTDQPANTPDPSESKPQPKSDQPAMNIEDLTKDLSYAPNPLINEPKQPTPKPSAAKKQSKPLTDDLNVLEGMYNDYVQTQDDKEKKFAEMLRTVTDKMSDYATLKDQFDQLNKKFIKLNNSVQAQAQTAQTLQNKTQTRGSVPLQTQIDDLRAEVENTQKQARDFHADVRKQQNTLAEKVATFEVDTYGAVGVTDTLKNLTQKVSRLESRWASSNPSNTSPKPAKKKQSQPQPKPKSQEEKPKNTFSIDSTAGDSEDNSETPTKTSQFDLRGIM